MMELRTEIKNQNLQNYVNTALQTTGLTGAAWLRQLIEKEAAQQAAVKTQKRKLLLKELDLLRQSIAAEDPGGPSSTQELRELRDNWGERNAD